MKHQASSKQHQQQPGQADAASAPQNKQQQQQATPHQPMGAKADTSIQQQGGAVGRKGQQHS